MQAKWHIQLLGRVRVTNPQGEALGFRSRPATALLVYLAVNAGEPCRRDEIGALFWPDHYEHQARASLRQALHRLRQVFGEDAETVMRSDSDVEDSLGLNTDAIDCDLWRLNAVSDGGREDQCAAISNQLGDVLADGLKLSSDRFEQWIAEERASVASLTERALSGAVDTLANGGDLPAAISLAKRRLALDDLNEAAHRRLIELHALEGRRDLAVRQYRTLRERLAEELSVEPSSDTRALFERTVRQDEGADGSAERPPVPVRETGPRKIESVASVLVVDDMKFNANLNAGIVRRLGHEAVVANNGVEALAKLDEQPFDFVIADWRMPEMDGQALAREINQRIPDLTDRPWLIAVTSEVSLAAARSCFGAGFDDYLGKPVHASQIEAVLDRWAHRKGEDGPALRFDITQIAGFLRCSADEARTEIAAFQKGAEENVKELLQGLEDGDVILAREHASTLRSNAQLLGVDELAQSCTNLLNGLDGVEPETALPSRGPVLAAFIRMERG